MARGYTGTSKEDIAFGKMDKFMSREGRQINSEPSLAQQIAKMDKDDAEARKAVSNKKEPQEEIRIVPYLN